MAFNFNFANSFVFTYILESLILDQLSVASTASYSLRKLKNAYTGSAIRVRRSLDNAEADIGFDGTDLDTTALMDFVGYQNLLSFSEEFNNVAWEGLAGSAETIAVNSEVAPDGTMTADRCTVISGTSGRFQNLTLPSAGQVTLSTYIKRGSQGTWARIGIYDTSSPGNQARCWFNMQTGNLGTIEAIGTGWSGVTAESTDVGNDWYRVVITATCTETAISALIANASSNGDTVRVVGHNRILWGAQLNQGATAQTYQQTVATANTANGFVATWYDQSGNARNATQATAGNQPQIVTGGVVNLLNGKPTLTPAGGNINLNATLALATPYSINAIANRTSGASGSSYQRLITSTPDAVFLIGTFAGNYISATGNVTNWNDVRVVNNPTTAIGSTPRVLTNIATTSLMTPYIDGAVMTGRTGSISTSTELLLFSRTMQSWIGNCPEVIVFTSALTTTDRQTLERNQGQYYSITVA